MDDNNIKITGIKKVISALIKRAIGYNDEEVQEEFAYDDEMGEKLIKKRVIKKFVPPDLSASKLLLEHFNMSEQNSYQNMSDDELDAEVDKLYAEYQKIKADEDAFKNLTKKDES